MKITIYGTRGSMPMAGEAFKIFGGQTSCYKLDIGDKELFLDAGSGIVPAFSDNEKNTYILLTHLHMDHIVGLPQFSGLSNTKTIINIYGSVNEDSTYKNIQEAINTAFAPPFWPISIDEYSAEIDWHDINPGDEIDLPGNIRITTCESNHPGGSIIYRIDSDEGSLVYATDYEAEESCDKKLIEFAKGCDLLIFDGQYTLEEAKKFKGFGHSTKEHGLEILKACDAKQIVYSHYSPSHTDAFLLEEEKRFKAMDGRVRFAKVGEVIELTGE